MRCEAARQQKVKGGTTYLCWFRGTNTDMPKAKQKLQMSNMTCVRDRDNLERDELIPF